MRDITVEWSVKDGGGSYRHFGLILEFVVHPAYDFGGPRTMAVIHDVSTTPHTITVQPITALTMRTGT